MINRLTKPEYICYLALAASSRSEDYFTKVGGVLVDKNWRVLNTSYNGYKSGMKPPERFLLEENRQEKGEHIIHGEQNLLANYTGDAFAIGLTISPCERCCDAIIAHNVQEVYYLQEYHRDTEKKFKKKLDFYGIKYFQLTKDNINNILNYVKDSENILRRLI